jgi:polysaccharide biosynthesis transport protein
MPAETGADLAFRSYARLIRRRKWWVIGIGLGGLALSLAFSLAQPDEYAATAQVLVQPASQSTALGTAQQPVTPTQVQTMQQLATSAPVLARVRRELGTTPAVTAAQVAQTNLIAITAVSAIPARAALVANAYAAAFVKVQRTVALDNLAAAESQLRAQIRSISKQVAMLRGTPGTASEQTALVNQAAVLREQLAQMQVNSTGNAGGLSLVTPAQVPSAPASRGPVEDGLLGLAGGLILGLGAAFLRDNLDDAVASKEAAEEFSGATVLTAVPMVTSWKRRDRPLVVSLARPMSPAAEAYRSLRTSLQFVRQEHDLRTILVTSPAAAEGKTSTLSNLGAVFAQSGERVLLVSCDLRKPRLGQFFGVDERFGLTTAILGEHSLEELIQPVSGNEDLWLLPSGQPPPNPAELLSGRRTQEIFWSLREHFDLVLIDSPPVLPVTDAVILSKDADATLLVVAAGQTRRGDLQRAAEQLAQVNARVTGVVLNETTKQGAGYGYGYGYGDSYLAEPATVQVPLQLNGAAVASHRKPSRGQAAPRARVRQHG